MLNGEATGIVEDEVDAGLIYGLKELKRRMLFTKNLHDGNLE